MKHLVFGGSFDPVHLGHLAIADAAQATLAPDLLSWVPSRHAPHKPDLAPASAEDRVAFLEAAILGREREQIDRRELGRPGPSYTVDTLIEMRAEDPKGSLDFLAGADSLQHLATWRDLPQLFEACHWWFAPRPGWGAAALESFRAALPKDLAASFRAQILPMEEVKVSSSEIRAAIASGVEAPGLPPAVSAEIAARGCYRS